ncbi:MAG: DUF547 domain-containing protein [Desulfobacterium sp.]|nr:DUF547 domain-containing protein [Desulfobacterium sp.]
MRKIKQWSIFLMAGLVIAGVFPAPEPARSMDRVDHSLFDSLLKKYAQGSNVNYQGFKQDEARLDDYLKILEQADPNTLSKNEQFTFYINAYNAWTIKLILTGYPGVESIKDLGGFFSSPWKKKIVRMNGKIITLDEIEHAILRPRFKDPRVHFAINCASRSCPPLRPEAYVGNLLDSQLNDATRRFLNDPKHNYLDGNDLYVSAIFKWFGEDFNKDIIGFFIQYTQDELRNSLKSKKNSIAIHYLDYDWSLNGK